jgi:hypothetical protein
MKENLFIINGRKIEIGKIVLDRDVLSVSEKSGEYNFYVCVSYHWREINELKVGEEDSWWYHEYMINKYNSVDRALVWPTYYVTKKISEDIICFDLKFEDLTDEKNICYMNMSGCFDEPLYNMEVKIYIDYRDAKDGEIVYEY